MTEAHDWPRYPFAVGEPVNTRCCVCNKIVTVPRPAKAHYPWWTPCPSCGANLGVHERAILRALDAAWEAQALADRQRAAKAAALAAAEDAEERARQEAIERTRQSQIWEAVEARNRQEAARVRKARKQAAQQKATLARKDRERTERTAALNAVLTMYGERIGHDTSRNEYIYLASRDGVPMREIAESMDISTARGYQIVQHYQRLLDRQKRMIRPRAHLAQCIEPTPNQRNVWHEYRIEDAYRA